jgi:hypothetical protein
MFYHQSPVLLIELAHDQQNTLLEVAAQHRLLASVTIHPSGRFTAVLALCKRKLERTSNLLLERVSLPASTSKVGLE